MIRCIRLLLPVLLLSHCAGVRADERAGDALRRATQFLSSRQDADGAWRSGVHGSFKDGPSLTPLVMTSLHFLRPLEPTAPAAYDKADVYLLNFVRTGDAGNFPLYTDAMGTWVAAMNDDAAHRAARDEWVRRLRHLQLNGDNGWTRDDLQFGAWGYHPHPLRPTDGQGDPFGPPTGNISATVFAIGALRMARVAPDDPTWRDALIFVQRCQNFQEDPALRDDRFDDGGFAFGPDDEAKNKPGSAGTDRFGRPRLHSYGSATADGVRCLLQCGLPPDHPRVRAAKDWLAAHFDVDKNPGEFNEDRAALARATEFYWLWSAAHALKRLKIDVIETGQPKLDWKQLIIDELLKQQRADGSWANAYAAGREDDPIVATSFATAALLVCTSPDVTGHPGPSEK